MEKKKVNKTVGTKKYIVTETTIKMCKDSIEASIAYPVEEKLKKVTYGVIYASLLGRYYSYEKSARILRVLSSIIAM